jgi:hypothetical protein
MTSSVWVDPLQLSYEEFLVRHNSMTDDEMRMAWYSNELFKKVIQIAEDNRDARLHASRFTKLSTSNRR